MPYRSADGTVYVVVALKPDIYELIEDLRRFEREGMKPRPRTKVIRDLMSLGIELHKKAHAVPERTIAPAECST